LIFTVDWVWEFTSRRYSINSGHTIVSRPDHSAPIPRSGGRRRFEGVDRESVFFAARSGWPALATARGRPDIAVRPRTVFSRDQSGGQHQKAMKRISSGLYSPARVGCWSTRCSCALATRSCSSSPTSISPHGHRSRVRLTGHHSLRRNGGHRSYQREGRGLLHLADTGFEEDLHRVHAADRAV
jgi:hypothetical protein